MENIHIDGDEWKVLNIYFEHDKKCYIYNRNMKFGAEDIQELVVEAEELHEIAPEQQQMLMKLLKQDKSVKEAILKHPFWDLEHWDKTGDIRFLKEVK